MKARTMGPETKKF